MAPKLFDQLIASIRQFGKILRCEMPASRIFSKYDFLDDTDMKAHYDYSHGKRGAIVKNKFDGKLTTYTDKTVYVQYIPITWKIEKTAATVMINKT